MRRNPANESVVEFVVTVRNSMLAAAEVMGAAETAVGMGYAKDFTVRVISEGASPSLGIRFIYDSSDNVLDREGKITRILEKAGGHVAGSSHARRNPLPMETDPFHPSKWLGNSTKGAFLDIGLKGSRNRQSLRGFVRIEPVVSLKSGFPLTHVAARYTSTIPEHWSSEGVLVDESPGHTLSIRFTFETPEGSASWLIFYGPYRPAKASEWHPEAPKSLVEAARVTKRHFESLFGQARLNPRRNPEGERHTSLKEQAESALLWERIRNAKSQKEALAHYRAALLAAENEQRLLRDRKKAGKGRKPKALYTKEYLAEKGTKRRNPPLSQQQQRKLMQALESDARSLSDIGNRPVGAMQFALFDENGNRMINWTYDMVGGSQEEPVLGMRPHPMWVIAPYAVGDEFDSMGYRYRVTAPNRAIRFARIRPKYYWDREGEQVLIPLGPPMKKNGRGR